MAIARSTQHVLQNDCSKDYVELNHGVVPEGCKESSPPVLAKVDSRFIFCQRRSIEMFPFN